MQYVLFPNHPTITETAFDQTSFISFSFSLALVLYISLLRVVRGARAPRAIFILCGKQEIVSNPDILALLSQISDTVSSAGERQCRKYSHSANILYRNSSIQCLILLETDPWFSKVN